MIRRAVVPLLIATAMALQPPSMAAAGTYNVTACENDTVNRSWGIYRSNGFADAMVDCTPRGTPPSRRRHGGAEYGRPWDCSLLFARRPVLLRRRRAPASSVSGTGAGEQFGRLDRGPLRRNLRAVVVLLRHVHDVATTRRPVASASRVSLRVFCAQAECARDGLHGYAALRYVTVTVADEGLPSVAMAGGSLLAGGWRRGLQDVVVTGSDPVGVRETLALLDGVPARRATHDCDPHQPAPCANGSDRLAVDTRTLGDGRHTISVQATDTAGNTRTVSRAVSIDNTAPASPQALSADGGNGWKAKNAFRLRWRNPAERHAPVVGAVVAVCPAAQRPVARLQCARSFHPTTTRRLAILHRPRARTVACVRLAERRRR